MANFRIQSKKETSEPTRRLRFGGKKVQSKEVSPPVQPKSEPPKALVGVCTHEGKKFYASRVPGNDIITLCVPTEKGILIRTDSQIIPTGEVKFDEVPDALVEEGKVAPFDVRPEFEIDEKMVTVKEDKRVTDYLDITLSGLASDFSEDRDGENVMPGAFKNTLADFRKNPVMLMDHTNSVRNIAGSFTRIREGNDGLHVEGKISNAPELRSIRFLVAEGHLKAFSIGGMMRFNAANYREIEEVKLFEVSLVAVPANPGALFHTRSLDLDSAKKAFHLL